jgi:hypothetical protein
VKRNEKGKAYLTGMLSPTAQVLIVPNEDKTDENAPSHLLYLLPIQPEQ